MNKRAEGLGNVGRRGLLKAGGALGLTAGVGAAGASGSASAAGQAFAPAGFQPGPIVQTAHGAVRGYIAGGVHTFRGVRYGASTGGANRFKPATPPAPWTGVQPCLVSRGGARAPQLNGPPAAPRAPDPDPPPISEDCLFLNIFTPGLEEGAKRPVMVWLHGGGWATGSGTDALSDGTRLARQGDVTIVTVNHRLNIFGYTYLEELLGPDYRDSGNLGVLDTIAALRWVRENIGRFGGDPGNVTLFGWSSGGSEVSQILAMPAADGLYHKAIIQSGAQLSLRTHQEAAAATDRLLKLVGVLPGRAEELLQLPMETLVAALAKGANASPTFDGHSLPRQPWQPDGPALAAKIPLIVGGTESELAAGVRDATLNMDEQTLRAKLKAHMGDQAEPVLAAFRQRYRSATPGQLFIYISTGLWTTKRTTQLAERKAALGGASVYHYQWTWKSPVQGGRFLSHHSVDLAFVWNNLDYGRDIVGFGPRHQALADRVSARWLAFARTGNPNPPGTVAWRPYTLAGRETLLIDDRDQLVADPYPAERLALEAVPDAAASRMLR